MTTVEQAAAELGLKVLTGGENLGREITGVYCCDLLSMVMGRAFSGCCWVTIMGNINSVAVASLADVSCIVYAEDVRPDEQTIQRAKQQGIVLLASSRPIFETALDVHQLL